jgi:Zn-dependent protease with chaperone function
VSKAEKKPSQAPGGITYYDADTRFLPMNPPPSLGTVIDTCSDLFSLLPSSTDRIAALRALVQRHGHGLTYTGGQ